MGVVIGCVMWYAIGYSLTFGSSCSRNGCGEYNVRRSKIPLSNQESARGHDAVALCFLLTCSSSDDVIAF